MSGLEDGLLAGLTERGVSRRAFLKFCAAMTAVLALPPTYAPRVSAAVAAAPRMPVVWLRGQGCGGETEALLRAANPTTSGLLLDLLSIDYVEALMVPAGRDAEAARAGTMRTYPNGYFAVIEGAVPTADDGVFLTIGGRPFVDIVRDVSAGAVATIAIGSCAFDGGLSAASGGSTGARGVGGVVPGDRLVTLPGCPVNVANLTATIVHYLTFKELPATDLRRRPLFAYGALIHNQCERRPHFEFGQFVQAWGDEGAQKGWCLYKMGCKGPESFANCPTARYGEGRSWPVKAGASCIACTMPGFWDAMSPFSRRLPSPVPFAPNLTADQVGLAAIAGVGGLAVVHGAASMVRARVAARHAAPVRHAATVGHAAPGGAVPSAAAGPSPDAASASDSVPAGPVAELLPAGPDAEIAPLDGAATAAPADPVEAGAGRVAPDPVVLDKGEAGLAAGSAVAPAGALPEAVAPSTTDAAEPLVPVVPEAGELVDPVRGVDPGTPEALP